MVTAAILGAAVGLGAALVLALSVLIYRYHAAQKKGAGLNRSWSDRDSWTASTSLASTYKSTDGRPDALNRPVQFYLPLNINSRKVRALTARWPPLLGVKINKNNRSVGGPAPYVPATVFSGPVGG